METVHNRNYGDIPVGVAVRGQIAKTVIYRVRRGNGHYDSVLGAEYQDKYAYFVPSSINNPQSDPYRRQWIAAVNKWRYDLTAEQKKEYNAVATNGLKMSGYNLFMRKAMNGEIDMYVDRGDPAGWDFIESDFTDDGTWRELDISAFIPVSAKAILMEVDFQTVNATKEIRFRKYGNSNAINHWDAETFFGNKHQSAMPIVAVDSNRKIEYNIDNATWTSLNVTIRGWWT